MIKCTLIHIYENKTYITWLQLLFISHNNPVRADKIMFPKIHLRSSS